VLAERAQASLRWSKDTMAHEYINTLGTTLASHATGYRYPYEFRIFMEPSIQSFALPGGMIYVSSGLVLAVDDESQLAGILAHQIGHVVARHGTQQISQALATTNSRLSQVSVAEAVSTLALEPAPRSVMFRHSLAAEVEADILAVQLLYGAKLDPQALIRGMARIASEPLNATREYLADHPAPANRTQEVQREMRRLGPEIHVAEEPADLRAVQNNLRAEAEPASNRTSANRSERPSPRFTFYEGYDFDMAYPENWMVTPTGSTVTLGPENAIVSGSLAYGVLVDSFVPRRDNPATQSALRLSAATDSLIDELRRTNPDLRVIRRFQRQIGGMAALEVELRNDSPVGGDEIDRLVTVLRPNGILSYFLAVTPETELDRYRPIFERMFSSIRFYN
jgi:hypothetical protein